jgi:hypothetical protein
MIIVSSPRQTLLAGSLAMSALAGLQPAPGAAADDRAVAVVEQVRGDVAVDRGGQVEPIAAGRQLLRHDRLTTGPHARVAVAFKDGSRLVLGGDGAVEIEDWRPEQGRAGGALLLDLVAGAVRLTAAKPHKAPDKRVELRTPVGVISVRGTDLWSGPLDSATGFIVLAGSIEARNDAGSVLIDKRHAGTLIRDRHTAPERPRGFAAEQIRQALSTVDINLK